LTTAAFLCYNIIKEKEKSRRLKMKDIQTGYFVRYRLYGINNTITLYHASQYHNWQDVMVEEFGKQFEIVGVYEFDY
jgi:hypothetical protein